MKQANEQRFEHLELIYYLAKSTGWKVLIEGKKPSQYKINLNVNKMELVLVVTVGIILIIIGLASCVLPPLPGPPIAFIALLLAHFGLDKKTEIPVWVLIVYAVVIVFVLIIDNLSQFGEQKN